MTAIWVLGILVLAAAGLEALGGGRPLAWAGGVLLAALGVQAGLRALAPRWKKWRSERARRRGLQKVDWKVIEQPGIMKDCEIPGSSGECTGIDCYVYFTCNYAKKKPLPK